MRNRENTECERGRREERTETNKTEGTRGSRKEREEQRVVSGFRETFGRRNLNGEASFTVVSSAGESSRFFTTRE